MKIDSITPDCIILHPESIEEAGIMKWLSMRFSRRTVHLDFETHLIGDGKVPYPAFWIRGREE